MSFPDPIAPNGDRWFDCFESRDVVEAHRNLLRALGRDITCPPDRFDPSHADLIELRSVIAARVADGVPWMVKEPSLMHLLPAWAAAGIQRARLVAVVRPPFDVIESIRSHDRIAADLAESIVEHAMQRLTATAEEASVSLITFDGSASVVSQVQQLAADLDLSWDPWAASDFFDERLVRHASVHHDTTPTYDRLFRTTIRSSPGSSVGLESVGLTSVRQPVLATHLGDSYVERRNELRRWNTHQDVDGQVICEITLRQSRPDPNRSTEIHHLQVKTMTSVSEALLKRRLRPDVLIAHGLFDSHSEADLAYGFRSLFASTSAFAQLTLDAQRCQLCANGEHHPGQQCGRADIDRAAQSMGWERIRSEPLAAGRIGVSFRKCRIDESDFDFDRAEAIEILSEGHLEQMRQRAEKAEQALERLVNRRSVRFTLKLASRAKPLFQFVRKLRR